jgi:hypothetical protein
LLHLGTHFDDSFNLHTWASRIRRYHHHHSHKHPFLTMPSSLAPFIYARPWLYKMFKPAAAWYANAASYRQLGL